MSTFSAAGLCASKIASVHRFSRRIPNDAKQRERRHGPWQHTDVVDRLLDRERAQWLSESSHVAFDGGLI